MVRLRETVVFKDGTGDIVFWKRWFHTASDVDDSAAIAFVHIPDVEQVDRCLNALAQQDLERDKSPSDEELCRSVGRDHRLIWADRPKEPSKRYAVTATCLLGCGFLVAGIYMWCCVLNLMNMGPDMSRFERFIALTLGLALPVGAGVCFLTVWAWNKEVERKHETKAQPSAAPLPSAPAGPSEGARTLAR